MIVKERGKNHLRVVLDTKRRKTKREFIGSTKPSSIFFDDLDFPGYISTQHLSLLTIFHSADHSRIYGIQASYRIKGMKEEIIGAKCLHSKQNDATKSLLRIDEGDRLRFVSGFARERILYLKLET